MSAAPSPAWRIERQGSGAVLRLSGNWLVGNSGLRAGNELRDALIRGGEWTPLRFDTSELARWDSALVAAVQGIRVAAVAAVPEAVVDLQGLPEPLRRLLALLQADDAHAVGGVDLAPPAGRHAVVGWAVLAAAAEIVGTTLLAVVPAVQGRLRARMTDVLALIQESGPGALGIVTVVNALVGAILAFVGAVQLQRFGAGIFVANLVGVAVIREMAAIMTAIVMAGRTGGAYAAQIATMEGNEEIDALRVLGIPPFQYLVIPRIAALIAVMPLLYFYGCIVGVAGGLLVGTAMLSIPPTVFLEQLRPAVQPAEFAIGLTKAICFGAFIALASCHVGLAAGRSAAEVGHAATSAVVAGIVGVIALDAVFAGCANALGI